MAEIDPPETTTSRLAAAALVVALTAGVLLPVVGAVAALVMARRARRAIARSAGSLSGGRIVTAAVTAAVAAMALHAALGWRLYVQYRKAEVLCERLLVGLDREDIAAVEAILTPGLLTREEIARRCGQIHERLGAYRGKTWAWCFTCIPTRIGWVTTVYYSIEYEKGRARGGFAFRPMPDGSLGMAGLDLSSPLLTPTGE